MITPEREAQIHRLYYREAWPIGTIARELSVHPSVVKRCIQRADESTPRIVRPTILDPYHGFIDDTLKRWPSLTARRLYDMCVERGYVGSPDHFRYLVRRAWPATSKKPEAFLRLHAFPGEQGQVDWGSFGHVAVGRARRQLLAFVVVLSWSRMIFLRFFLGGAMPSFLRGHLEAFEWFGAVPRRLLYDNLKSAVIERHGDAIRFHPKLLELSTHYGFEPLPVPPRRPNEKGRVERAIRFVRDSFFAGRTWSSIDDLNQQAFEWCRTRAAERPWPDDKTFIVRDKFAEELPKLRALPADRFNVDLVTEVKIGKTPHARFDGNLYSVPHDNVGRTLMLVATEIEVRVLDGIDVVARHRRSYDRGACIEVDEHIAALRAHKRKARHGRVSERLLVAAPSVERLLAELALRGDNLGSACAHFLRLLDEFGPEALDRAALAALERGTPHPRSVRFVLEKEQSARGEVARPPMVLPDDPRLRELTVRPHELSTYDSLHRSMSSPTEVNDAR